MKPLPSNSRPPITPAANAAGYSTVPRSHRLDDVLVGEESANHVPAPAHGQSELVLVALVSLLESDPVASVSGNSLR